MEASPSSTGKAVSRSKPSLTIVTRIADREGISPTELTPPLYSAIDPEALDTLFSSSTTDESQPSRHVRFTYKGYEVLVRSADDISIVES